MTEGWRKIPDLWWTLKMRQCQVYVWCLCLRRHTVGTCLKTHDALCFDSRQMRGFLLIISHMWATCCNVRMWMFWTFSFLCLDFFNSPIMNNNVDVLLRLDMVPTPPQRVYISDKKYQPTIQHTHFHSCSPLSLHFSIFLSAWFPFPKGDTFYNN